MLSSSQDAAGNFVLTSAGDISRNFVLSTSADGSRGNFVLSNGSSNGAKMVSLATAAPVPGVQKLVNSSPDLVLHAANQFR